MKRVLKWIAILLGLVVIFVGGLHVVGNGRLQNAPQVTVKTVDDHNNDETLARGQHLATISSCNGCHGIDLSGELFANEAPMGYLPAPNLTSGAGGVGATYTAEDWARAIRHGVAADGRTIMIMASNHYAAMSDNDLTALIAYLQSVPPVDNDLGERAVPFPGTIIFGMFAYDDITAVNKIDHAAVGGDGPEMGETAVYGEYLVNITSCGSCHAENLTGNTDPNAGPLGPDITMNSNLQVWSQADFMTALRTGFTPSGTQLDPEMPWAAYAQMTDTELGAIWAYLQGTSTSSSN